jgi:hypothetical protein
MIFICYGVIWDAGAGAAQLLHTIPNGLCNYRELLHFLRAILIYYPRAAKLASLAPGRKMAMAPARGQGRVERMRGLPALMFSFDQGNIIEIY